MGYNRTNYGKGPDGTTTRDLRGLLKGILRDYYKGL